MSSINGKKEREANSRHGWRYSREGERNIERGRFEREVVFKKEGEKKYREGSFRERSCFQERGREIDNSMGALTQSLLRFV